MRRAVGDRMRIAVDANQGWRVAAIADAMPARYRAAVLVAAWSGLRGGELFALRRRDVANGPADPPATWDRTLGAVRSAPSLQAA